MGFNKGIIIAVLLASLAFLSLSSAILTVAFNYNVPVGNIFNETFDKYYESTMLVEGMEDTITGGEINPAGQDQAVYKQVIVAGKTSRQSANLATDMLSVTPNIIPMDAKIIIIVMSVVFTLSTFAFIGMISRREP